MVHMRHRWKRLPLLLVIASTVWGQRDVVSLSSPLTETAYLLGAGNRLALVSDSSVFPDQVVRDRDSGLVGVVNFGRPDLAAIEAVQPSLVLTSTRFQREIAAELRKRGLKVLHFEPQSIEDILKQTEQVGAALGKGTEALRMVASMRSDLAEIQRKSAGLPKVRVYMEINHVGPWTVGAASAETEMIRLAGGENVFADHPDGVFVTSNAEVVRHNPEVILSPIWLNAKVGGIDGITTLFEIMSRPGFAETAAVKQGGVLYYDSALLKQQGPREVIAVRKLAYLLHPEAFENPPDTIPWELGRVYP
jgi:iron complex transport system substrate-binding protein